MDNNTVKDIHTRLGRLEENTQKILANTENLKWQKWHIRALWATLLGMLGVNNVH